MTAEQHQAESEQAIRRIVVDTGLDPGDGIRSIEPLEGGVSSDIARVLLPDGPVCVKRALSKLKVKADWRVPVERNLSEYRWYETAAEINAECVPRLYGHSVNAQGFAMAYLPPENYRNWKSELMKGQVEPLFAGQVGTALGEIHARTAGDRSVEGLFANAGDFFAIRIEPYLLYTAKFHPDVAPQLQQIADEQHAGRVALVHGDVSPKNILAGPQGPVFLDAECANYGDPAFDVAFCLNHLLLKMVLLPECVNKLRQSALEMVNSHRRKVTWEDRAQFDGRVARLLPGLMLGRVDGKSPVEYLNEEQTCLVRNKARSWLLSPPQITSDLIDSMAAYPQ